MGSKIIIAVLFLTSILIKPKFGCLKTVRLEVPRSVIEANSNRRQQGEPRNLYDLHQMLYKRNVPRSVIEANSNRGQQEREPLTLYDLHRMLYKRNADLLSDPRFINCIEEMNGAVDNQDAMAFYAKCFSFVGRPRFGKRGMYKPLREGKRSSGVRVHYEEPSQYYEK